MCLTIVGLFIIGWWHHLSGWFPATLRCSRHLVPEITGFFQGQDMVRTENGCHSLCHVEGSDISVTIIYFSGRGLIVPPKHMEFYHHSYFYFVFIVLGLVAFYSLFLFFLWTVAWILEHICLFCFRHRYLCHSGCGFYKENLNFT